MPFSMQAISEEWIFCMTHEQSIMLNLGMLLT